MPDNDFKLVKTRRNKRSLSQKIPKNIHLDRDENNINKESALRRIREATEEISTSDYFFSILDILQQGLKQLGTTNLSEIVCYGLGHIAESVSSRYQLGLLLSLKSHFPGSVFVSDPIFYNSEIEILKELDCEIITINEEGKRKISTETTTLIYLPHCPKQLTNNFLWANWGPELKNCMLFSNSFNQVIESNPIRILNESASYILKIQPHTKEFSIINSFKYTDIFNDSAIHIFPQDKLAALPDVFWNSHKEPKYPEGDIEFISKQLTTILELDN